MDITTRKSNEEIIKDQAIEMRELIPEVVKGLDTSSMACCPTEVFYFADLYIKELQEENKKLKNELNVTKESKVNVFGKMVENLKDENFIKNVKDSLDDEPLKIQHWSFTMDYEANEIVMKSVIDGEEIQLRACEKDIKSMQSWFDLARYMKKNSNC